MLTEGLKTIILSLIKIKTGYFKIYRLNSFTSPSLETNNIIYFTQEKKGKKKRKKKGSLIQLTACASFFSSLESHKLHRPL